ncbi:MAG TPA: hypothetical protein VJS69_08850 [Candidatus Krumholzibacteria bacterium]|nr:hypothetical protein [Candidatus Krumholzibacteria bacterium]
MKILVTCLLLLGLCASANAAVVWDESVNGLLSTNPAAPTPITLSGGSNVINGQVGNVSAQPRDYVTFTIAAGHTLTAINLLGWSPSNTGFAAINAGNTSIIPSNPTIDFWMAGIHIDPTLINTDLLDKMRDASVTTQSLDASQIDPGDYTFIIQQTSPFFSTYSLEFVLDSPVATEPTTWGSIKALYR